MIAQTCPVFPPDFAMNIAIVGINNSSSYHTG